MTPDDPNRDEALAQDHYGQGATCIRTGHPFLAREHFRTARRLDPARPEYERGFVFADQCCRWIYLPQYWLTQAYRRLPGGRFGVWILILVGAMPLLVLDASPRVRAAFLVGLLIFCVYSWSAHLLVALWVRRYPPC